MEATYYGFTGKPYRDINLSQLVNSINKKELEVHVNFSIGTTFYRIERGIKPNLFRIYKKEGEVPGTTDEDLIPLLSATRNYQQVFEEDTMQFPVAKILDQVGIKSLTKNMSFLSLGKAEKREIVENLLDIKVFTEMNKIAKTKVDALEKDLADSKKSMESAQTFINQEESNIDRLLRIQAKQREDIANQADRMNREVEEIEADCERIEVQNILLGNGVPNFEAQIVTLQEQIQARVADSAKKKLGIEKIQKYKVKKTELKAAINNVEIQIRGHLNNIGQIEDTIRDHKSVISLSENKVKFLTKTCGGCSKIDSISHADNVDGVKKQIADANIEIESIRTTMEFLTLDIKAYNTQIGKCDEFINMERPFMSDIETNKRLDASDQSNIETNKTHIQQNVGRIEQNLDRIKRNMERIIEKQNTIHEEKKQEIEIDYTKLEDHKAKWKTLNEIYNKKAILKKHYVYARKLLADDAIKSFVVNKYLPSINMILNSYLQKFGSEFTLNLDSEFNEVFTTRFKEHYTYFSLSEGQKKRVDLAILFMWRKFCQTKFQQADLNFLILDEVSSGLDVETQEKLTNMLKVLAKEENKSIITISHDPTIDPEKIDHMYEVAFEAGFSKLTKKTTL
jgi:DNA repair exonuclease SbcCD ATPase subunit